MGTNGHWQHIAKRWDLVGSPFRPCAQDVELYRQALSLPSSDPWRGLILGVTPELQRLDWPAGSTVVAADRSEPMIRAIWPGPFTSAHVAQWDDLPFEDGSFDRVVCDGGLHLQLFPEGHARLVRSIARVLRPGGRLVIRLFTLPTRRETAGELMEVLHAGGIPDFHCFKMRLAMALQEDHRQGIQLDLVFRQLISLAGDLDQLAERTGWPIAEIETVRSYQDSHEVFHFLTEKQSIDALTEGQWLSREGTWFGKYPLSERCPVMAFQRTSHP